MTTEGTPQHYPRQPVKWITTFFEWAYVNVLLGALPILMSLLLIAVANGPFSLPTDFTLSLVVLAMTIAATGIDSLKELKTGLGKAQWLQRLQIFTVIFGALLAVVCTSSDLIRPEKLNASVVFLLCVGVLILVLPLSFASHAFGLQGRDAEVERIFRIAQQRFEPDPEYLQMHEAREKRLQEAMIGKPSSYNGVRV